MKRRSKLSHSHASAKAIFDARLKAKILLMLIFSYYNISSPLVFAGFEFFAYFIEGDGFSDGEVIVSEFSPGG